MRIKIPRFVVWAIRDNLLRKLLVYETVCRARRSTTLDGRKLRKAGSVIRNGLVQKSDNWP